MEHLVNEDHSFSRCISGAFRLCQQQDRRWYTLMANRDTQAKAVFVLLCLLVGTIWIVALDNDEPELDQISIVRVQEMPRRQDSTRVNRREDEENAKSFVRGDPTPVAKEQLCRFGLTTKSGSSITRSLVRIEVFDHESGMVVVEERYSQTSETGVLSLPFDRRFLSSDRRLRFEFTIDENEESFRGSVVVIASELEKSSPVGVVMDGASTIVSGIVVAEYSGTLDDVFVECAYSTSSGNQRASCKKVVKCDKNNRFSFRCEGIMSRARLRLISDDLFADQVVVSGSFQGVVINATSLGRLKARIELQDANRPRDLYVKLESKGDVKISELDFDGFVDQSVKPGTYSLEISSNRDFAHKILSRQDLVISAGSTLDLGRIQVEARFSNVSLSVLFGDSTTGKVTRYGLVRSFVPSTDILISQRACEFFGDPIQVPVEISPVELEVFVPGFRIERKLITTRTAEIRLQKGWEVEFTVLGLQNVDLKKWNVSILLESARETSIRLTHRIVETGQPIVMFVPKLAEFRVSMRIVSPVDSALVGELDLETQSRFMISSSAQTRKIALAVRRSSVNGVLKMLSP